MGIGVQTITPVLASALKLPRDSGVLISDLVQGGPGESAGLKLNDILLTADGTPIDNLPRFMMATLVHQGGAPIQLRVLRGSELISETVAAVEEEQASDHVSDLIDPEKDQVPKLGIIGVGIDRRVEAIFPNLRRPYGVFVAATSEAPTGAFTGLQAGDLVHEVNGVMVSSVETLRQAVDPIKRGEPVALFIEREGKLLYLAFEVV